MDAFKPIEFLGSSLDDLRDFPIQARREAGRLYVLHCFQMKTKTTSKSDIDLANKRFGSLLKELRK